MFIPSLFVLAVGCCRPPAVVVDVDVVVDDGVDDVLDVEEDCGFMNRRASSKVEKDLNLAPLYPLV